jgi:hypothetical protein
LWRQKPLAAFGQFQSVRKPWTASGKSDDMIVQGRDGQAWRQ